MDLNSAQIKNREYNLLQTEVGHALKTLKGSAVKRSNFGVGKLIGGQFYFHKSYAKEVLPPLVYRLIDPAEEYVPFDYNCMRWTIKSNDLSLVESPDFDESREPVVGRMFSIDLEGNYEVSRFYNQIWHHKWLWVKNDYTGFSVADSWNWSKTWLSELTEPADGTNKQRWLAQLEKFNLQ